MNCPGPETWCSRVPLCRLIIVPSPAATLSLINVRRKLSSHVYTNSTNDVELVSNNIPRVSYRSPAFSKATDIIFCYRRRELRAYVVVQMKTHEGLNFYKYH